MKFSILTTLLAGAGIAQYAVANPMRVVVITNSKEPSNLDKTPELISVWQPTNPPMMIHEAEPQNLRSGRRPCSHSKLKESALRISNAFKQAIGLPLPPIKPSFHTLSFLGPHGEVISPNGPNHHPHHHHHHHKKSFLRRVHHALMSLGPWEGRTVAFVLGCGIGVLLRMVWVMAVITYRLLRGEREDHQYIAIVCEQRDGDLVPPPQYIQEKTVYTDVDVDAKQADQS